MLSCQFCYVFQTVSKNTSGHLRQVYPTSGDNFSMWFSKDSEINSFVEFNGKLWFFKKTDLAKNILLRRKKCDSMAV